MKIRLNPKWYESEYGPLTYAMLYTAQVAGLAWLLLVMGWVGR